LFLTISDCEFEVNRRVSRTSPHIVATIWAATAPMLALWPGGIESAYAACSQIGTNQTCTNSAVLNNTATPGITDTGTLSLTNTATGAVGTSFNQDGVHATGAANVVNSGSITGLTAINANNDVTVSNTGAITGQGYGIYSNAGTVTLTNSGTISQTQGGFPHAAVFGPAGVTVSNTGTISGVGEGIYSSSGNAAITNSGTITGQSYAIYSNAGPLTLTNSGTISQTQGASAAVLDNTGAVTVSNTGTISGVGLGIETSTGNATVTNSGTISGQSIAGVISVAGNVAVTNSGTITGGRYGVAAGYNVSLVNSGTVSGVYGVLSNAGQVSVTNSGNVTGGASAGGYGVATNLGGSVVNSGAIGGNIAVASHGPMTLTNAGLIWGSGGTAILFTGSNDVLTLDPGSTIIGKIQLGTHDTVNVNARNQNLTFNSLSTATIAGSVPYVVSGNRIASVDVTGFAGADRNLLAVIDAISGSLGGQTASGSQTVASGGGALGFTGPGYVAANAEEVFADVLGYAKAPNDAVVFKNPSLAFDNGSMIWAKGFIGQRSQEASGPVLGNLTNFYGGMVGVDRAIAPDLKLGALAGGGNTSTAIGQNAGSSASDLGFGGIYGRKEFGPMFVDFDVIAGGSSNRSARNINNNLAPGGLETASASFGGWFVSPEAAVGYRRDVMPGLTLTPAARLRYLAAGFDGYTETGSTANLTVGSRIAQALEERGEITLTNTNVSDLGRFQIGATLGVIGQQRVGDGNLNTILLGQALAFASPGKADIAGGFVSGQFDWKTRWGATLFASVECSAYTDSSTIVTGRAGVRIGF
jgi:uncharacterized protein with beta-barrel porin domain